MRRDLHIVGNLDLLLGQSEVVLYAREGDTRYDDTVSVGDDLAVRHADVAARIAVEEQPRYHQEGHIDRFFFTVDLYGFVLIVFIVEADGDIAALADELIGRDRLAVQLIGHAQIDGERIGTGAAQIQILALYIPYAHILAVEGKGGVGFDVFDIIQRRNLGDPVGVILVLDPVGNDDLIDRSVGFRHDINGLVFIQRRFIRSCFSVIARRGAEAPSVPQKSKYAHQRSGQRDAQAQRDAHQFDQSFHYDLSCLNMIMLNSLHIFSFRASCDRPAYRTVPAAPAE